MQPMRLIRLLVLLPIFASAPILRAARKETWVEVKSPHFVAYSDAGESEARKALEGFEGIRSVYGRLFPGIRVDPPKPMILVVTEDETSMKRFLPDQFEGRDPKRPAGIFLQRSDRNYAALRLDIHHQVDQPYFVLFHEYTHSIIHQNVPSIPTWLDEGIADFYGATEIRSERVFIGRVPRGRLQDLREKVRLPLETLLAVNHDSPHYKEGEKAGIFYAQSWAFVHYLFMNEKAKQAGLLQSYLRALSRTADPLAAAREGFGDLNKLQGELTSYYFRPMFSYWNLPLTVKLTDKDFRSRTLGDAEALVIRAEFLQYNHKVKEAKTLLEQAQGMTPKAPEVTAAIGYGYMLQGEGEKARAAFEEALRLGSQDFRVPYQLARLAQAGEGGGGTERATQILAWLETARNLCPEFPGTHMALCRQYASEPKDPVKALPEGREALDLEPQNLGYRANLGEVCIRLNLEKQAKEIGDQLDKQAITQAEKRIAANYAASLTHFLERRKTAEASNGPAPLNMLPATEPAPVSQPTSIKFSLPSYFAPLGQEVLQLISEGKPDEAIRRVEMALAAATNDYDRKALRTLLKTLRKGTPAK